MKARGKIRLVVGGSVRVMARARASARARARVMLD